MNKEIYTKRREELRKKMHEKEFDALLVSFSANRYYLSGFELHDGQCNETSGYLVITKSGKDLLCTDSRFTLAAQELWEHENIRIYAGSLTKFYNKLFKDEKFQCVGFDEQCLTYAFTQEAFEGINHSPAHGLIEDLRLIKDEEEIKLIKTSAKLNHKLMEYLPKYLEENISKGITEKDCAWHIESFFRNNGASGNAFEPIVAQNQHAALPHCIPSDTILKENSLLLVDVGARLGDYNSDQTRTFWLGNNPTDRFKKTLEQVQKAQEEAIKILRPDLKCSEAYEASFKSFEKEGVAQYFTHSLGHGVGLETHEAPRLSRTSETILKAGMVVTVEPGLYYADWGGIRWEYMVLITENGCEIL